MTEENENAMDDSVFTGFLQQIGLAPPSNEQVGFFLFSFLFVFLYIYIFFKIIIALFTYGTACYFSFQPVLHDWCIKGHGMCYSVCGNLCTNWKEYPIKW